MATLLETVFAMGGSAQEVEDEVLARLRTGSLKLSGNFRGQEHSILGERSDSLEGRSLRDPGSAAPFRVPSVEGLQRG